MAYDEKTAQATTYRRAWRVEIENPLVGVPAATFHREKVVDMGAGDIIKTPAGAVTGWMTDANIEVPLIDPDTLQPLGQSMTYAQLYVGLVSLFIALDTADLARQAEQGPLL